MQVRWGGWAKEPTQKNKNEKQTFVSHNKHLKL